MINSFAFVPSLYASLLSRQLFSHLNAAALLAIARFLFMLPSASVSSGLIRAGVDVDADLASADHILSVA